uniref:Uncharacterized protein n=1 Tax=Rhizophora mucronata TaxID=61149 RepID=A0A2P2PF92_RHIMU
MRNSSFSDYISTLVDLDLLTENNQIASIITLLSFNLDVSQFWEFSNGL